jgi:hypothetical protein
MPADGAGARYDPGLSRGILLSGALYQVGGMEACLVASAVMLIACWFITLLLPTHEASREEQRLA